MADAPLTAARLRALLAGREPRVFWFEAGQTREERAALMATVPPEAQEAALKAMKEAVLDHLEDLPDRPLLYFMAADDEPVDEEAWEERQHSYDWRLILHEGAGGLLCDFNGWPGDNEAGAGVYRGAESGALVILFENGDRALTAAWEEHREVVDDYEERREALGGGTESAGEGAEEDAKGCSLVPYCG